MAAKPKEKKFKFSFTFRNDKIKTENVTMNPTMSCMTPQEPDLVDPQFHTLGLDFPPNHVFEYVQKAQELQQGEDIYEMTAIPRGVCLIINQVWFFEELL